MENAPLILLGFLAMIVLLTLAVRYGAVFAGRIMGADVNAKHRAMEYILDTEKIPLEWLEPAPREPAQAGQWQERQKRNALERLNKLISHAAHTPAFEDAESRAYVLRELDRIQLRWSALPFAEIADAPATG
jgi:hypothetical protein